MLLSFILFICLFLKILLLLFCCEKFSLFFKFVDSWGMPFIIWYNLLSKFSVNNEETNELLNAINEKDKEIANLKEYIETLEQKLKISSENQNQLEAKIKELNSLLLQ